MYTKNQIKIIETEQDIEFYEYCLSKTDINFDVEYLKYKIKYLKLKLKKMYKKENNYDSSILYFA